MICDTIYERNFGSIGSQRKSRVNRKLIWLTSKIQCNLFLCGGQERVHHVNFLQPHQRGVQHFSLPEYSENSGKCISITLSTHVETVVLLSQLKQKPDDYINVTIELDDMDITSAQTNATYDEIKKYVSEHNDGMKVSNLYISQVKRAQLWRH